MAYDQSISTTNVRAAYYDKAIKAIANREYKFKQALSIESTGAWTNYFWREDPQVLTNYLANSTTSTAFRGIPRGAEFPQASASWERVSTTIEKFGAEEYIPWEDIISGEIDMQNRTLAKITEAVVKAVDDQIYAVLSESDSPVNIQTIQMSISQQKGWNASSAAIVDDLLEGLQIIAQYNIDTSNAMLFINSRDRRSIMNYIAEKGAQWNSQAGDILDNGYRGTIAGIKLIESQSVPASRALLVVPKVCGTWKELVPLQTNTKEDPFKNVLIRAVEEGVCQLVSPKAVVLYKNTQVAALG